MKDFSSSFVLAVVGPTASGKTKLGVALAKEYSGEIISADSMQIYKDIPIASAAPSVEERESIPHHLIGFLDLHQSYSVAEYVSMAQKKVLEISSENRLPILVGGTGLYVRSLLDNIQFHEQSRCAEIQDNLWKQAKKKGNQEMWEQLSAIDPIYAQSVHPNNVKRVIRALTLHQAAGITMTQQLTESKQRGACHSCRIGLNYKDRRRLYQRIDKRVDKMLEKGLFTEAKYIYQNRQYSRTIAQAIGIKEFFAYFDGQISYERAVELIKQRSRNYAKRQLTWFKKDSQIHWFYADAYESEEDLLSAVQRDIKPQICKKA